MNKLLCCPALAAQARLLSEREHMLRRLELHSDASGFGTAPAIPTIMMSWTLSQCDFIRVARVAAMLFAMSAIIATATTCFPTRAKAYVRPAPEPLGTLISSSHPKTVQTAAYSSGSAVMTPIVAC